jgi:23S rRNA (uracil1939-C5)-methyltransferase
VLNTYLIFLRFQLLRGGSTPKQHAYESGQVDAIRAVRSPALARVSRGLALGATCGLGAPFGLILDLTHDCQGVADVDGRRCSCRMRYRARPSRSPAQRRRKLLEAELVRVIEPSPDRVRPDCEYFGRCGGCALQHLAHDAQVRFKQGVVAQALTRIARVEPEEWLPAFASRPWRYRRRARLGVKYVPGKERVLVGFRERSAPYITDMAHCPVLMPPLDALLGPLAELIAGTSIKERLPQIEAAVGTQASALVLRVLDAPSTADVESFAAFGAAHGIDMYLQPGGPGTIAPIGAARR